MALLLDRPFVEGDYVQIMTGETCRVDKIGIRSCRLYDVFANDYIVLPNNKLVNDKIVNLNEPDGKGVGEITLSVVPTADVSSVEKILLEVASRNDEVLKDEGVAPSVRLAGFSESGLDFKLFFWVSEFMSKWRVAHELRKEIVARFAKSGIEMAVPQRTVYVKYRSKQ
jgi:small-conductance mechanosensitive channel